MSEMLEIHKIVKTQMIYKDMSNADLSKITGIPQSTLGRKLRGEAEFTLLEAKLVADALEIIEPWDIFFNTKKPKSVKYNK